MRSTLTALPNFVAPRIFIRVCSSSVRDIGQHQRFQRHWPGATYRGSRALQTETGPADTVPLRKQLKDEAKQKRAAGLVVSRTARRATTSKLEAWELTVGIEVHAQLNTERKLFSGGYSRTAFLGHILIILKRLQRPSVRSRTPTQRSSTLPFQGVNLYA